MKEIVLVHPVGQAFALVFGLFNIITGYTRRCFNVSIHLNCGIIYYLAALFGAGLGIMVTRWAHAQNLAPQTELHKAISMAMIVVFAAGATTGFLLMRGAGARQRLAKLHSLANLAGIILFGAQLFTGIAILKSLF